MSYHDPDAHNHYSASAQRAQFSEKSIFLSSIEGVSYVLTVLFCIMTIPTLASWVTPPFVRFMSFTFSADLAGTGVYEILCWMLLFLGEWFLALGVISVSITRLSTRLALRR